MKVYVWVEDGRGNGGGADVAVSPHPSSLSGMSGGQTLLYAALGVVLFVFLIACWQYSLKRSRETLYIRNMRRRAEDKRFEAGPEEPDSGVLPEKDIRGGCT